MVVAPHAVHGGQEEWLLQLLDATSRLDVRVLLLQDGALRRELEARNIPVDVVPVGRRPVDVAWPILRISALLRAARPDVVLTNGVKAQIVAGPAARLAGVPLVFARHDHAFESIIGQVARFADAVIGPSEEALAPVGRSATVIPPPRPPLTPLDRAAARVQLESLGVPTDGLLIGMLTRLVAYKGVEDAIRALSFPGAEDWRLVVLGGDDPSEPGERQRLSALATDLGVAGRVLLTDYVAEASRLVAAFDALAVLTRSDGTQGPAGEGFGMTALEAMTAGVPVIAVGGGPVERRMAGRAGIVVPSADPPAVAAALGLLTDAGERRRRGNAGVELSADHPDAATCADRLCAVLATAARRPGAGLAATEPVSVVVPVYDEGEPLEASLVALHQQLGPDDELVVVDDGSTDGTADRLRALAGDLAQLRPVLRPVNGGPSAARNTGVRHSAHALVVCTDAGADAPVGWVTAMRAALCDQTAPDLVAGAYRARARTPWEHAMAAALYPAPEDIARSGPLARTHRRLFGGGFSPDRPSGRSLGFRRAAWERVGGFREDLRYAEDTAFGLAIAEGGRCVAQTDHPVVWHQRETLLATARMFARYGRGDALQGERVVAARNAARALAAVAVLVLVPAGGRGGRAAVTVAGAAYAGLPMWRVRSAPRPFASAALVPVALATQDLAKAWGYLQGLRTGRRR